VLTVAYLNTVWNVDEFSAVDYTLNIVSKYRFFFIFKHSQAPKRSWKMFYVGPGKSWRSSGFLLSVKEWEPCVIVR